MESTPPRNPVEDGIGPSGMRELRIVSCVLHLVSAMPRQMLIAVLNESIDSSISTFADIDGFGSGDDDEAAHGGAVVTALMVRILFAAELIRAYGISPPAQHTAMIDGMLELARRDPAMATSKAIVKVVRQILGVSPSGG
jgi:hypothetical protein